MSSSQSSEESSASVDFAKIEPKEEPEDGHEYVLKEEEDDEEYSGENEEGIDEADEVEEQDFETSIEEEHAIFECPEELCGRTFSNAHNLNRHIKTFHVGNSDSRCEFCGRFYKTKEAKETHALSHKGVKIKPHRCSYPGCTKAYRYLSQLKTHSQRHRHVCPYEFCALVLPTHNKLRSHIAKLHKDDSHQRVCDVCGKVCTTPSNLKEHVMTHSSKRDEFPCPEPGCPRTFLFKKNLRQHVRIAHTGEGRFRCDFCGMSLSTKQKLRMHEAVYHDPSNPRDPPVRFKNKRVNKIKRKVPTLAARLAGLEKEEADGVVTQDFLRVEFSDVQHEEQNSKDGSEDANDEGTDEEEEEDTEHPLRLPVGTVATRRKEKAELEVNEVSPSGLDVRPSKSRTKKAPSLTIIKRKRKNPGASEDTEDWRSVDGQESSGWEASFKESQTV